MAFQRSYLGHGKPILKKPLQNVTVASSSCRKRRNGRSHNGCNLKAAEKMLLKNRVKIVREKDRHAALIKALKSNLCAKKDVIASKKSKHRNYPY